MRELTKIGGRVLGWLMLGALCVTQMQAQHYAFQVYAEENGLQNLNIQSLLQDHNGFIWAGTQNGLYRYEGLRFTAFGRDEGLTDTMISCLHETADGVLWVATRSGLFEFDGQRFRSAADGTSWEIRSQFGMASDVHNRLFVATSHGLLIGEAPATPGGSRKFHFYSHPGLPAGEVVSSVHVDRLGAVWFSSGTKLYRLQQGILKVLGSSEGLPDQAWNAILGDRDGNIWLRSLEHVFVADSQSGRFVRRETGMPVGEARNYLALDEQGRILLPANHGLGRWTPAGWKFMTKANGLPGDSVCCVLTDREGSRWIGMRGTGLSRSKSLTQWESWGRDEGLLSEEVWAIERASNGSLWVGTSSGLEQLPVRKDSGVSGVYSIILSFARGKDGRLWAGTAKGQVLEINERTGSVRRFGAEAGLSGTSALSVLSLMIDSSGDLWASTTEGLFEADASSDHPRFARVPLPSRSRREMFHQCVQDGSGAVWAAGQEGLARWKNRKWTRFGSAEGLLDTHVTGIAVEPDGDLWISYAKKPGVSRLLFEGKGKLRVQHFSRANGLHSDQIMSIAADRRGWVWLTGDNGVDVFQGGSWQYFGRTQGLVWNDCNSNAFYEDTDGTVWIGTSRGLAHWLAPGDSLPQPAPPVLITAALWGPHSLVNPSKPSNVYDFEKQSLLISFTGLTFENESAVQFRYRLRRTDRGRFLGPDGQQGIEPEWVETASREVRFPGLQAGSFTFEVLARSADRIWSKTPARLQFTILPPWWQTWWFRALELGAILLAIRQLWIWRTSQLIKRQRELEQAVVERTKELDAERKKFQELATWDSVTGVWNRRAILELLSNELARAKRSNGTVAVIMADLDRFKQVNDRYGHQAGDAVLKEAAQRMKRTVRVSDGLGRYGGEEFLIVLPECDREVAIRRAEAILAFIAETPISTPAGELSVTCSMGVNWTRDGCYDPTWLIKEADAALYRAKHAGRNRVEMALEEVVPVGEKVAEPA